MAELIATSILGVLYLCMAACVFMLVRNQWVFSVRIRLLDEDFDAYRQLPSYDEMMRRFWVWDVETFKSGGR